MKKNKKKKGKNPWESDDGSGTRSSSAEEQFEALDKEMMMEKYCGRVWELGTLMFWRGGHEGGGGNVDEVS